MKRKIFVFLSLLTFVLFVCGCKEEIIEMPTVVIDETIGQEDSSEVKSNAEVESENSNTNVDHSSSSTVNGNGTVTGSDSSQAVVDHSSSSTVNGNGTVTGSDSSQAVDLSDRAVILGQWEIISRSVDGKEETSDTKYLVITEDYKFYYTNNLKSLSGDYRYSYENGVITVILKNQVDETYAVTMKSGDELTLKYESSAKNYVDIYKKVQ